MRPCRYFPRNTPTPDVIDNLVYVMQTMSETQESSTNGIGFIANMNDWQYSNFSLGYCAEFMATLQERIPARVTIFLIVNPPPWFPTIWRIMKGMSSRNFRRKVHMINESQLSKYLMDDYETYLPDEFSCGKGNTDQIVKDFITYRKFVEITEASVRY
jgi:hypothetical protein